MKIIIIILCLPFILGYIIGVSRYASAKFESFSWSVERAIIFIFNSIIFIFNWIPTYLRDAYYLLIKKRGLIKKTRAGDNKALAQRLANLPRKRERFTHEKQY